MIVTDADRAAGALTAEHLATALRRLREAGYVVFESLIPQELTRELRDAFQVIHEEEFRDRESDAEWNRRGGPGARLEHPFMHPLMIENPIGMQVMEAVWGRIYGECSRTTRTRRSLGLTSRGCTGTHSTCSLS